MNTQFIHEALFNNLYRFNAANAGKKCHQHEHVPQTLQTILLASSRLAEYETGRLCYASVQEDTNTLASLTTTSASECQQ